MPEPPRGIRQRAGVLLVAVVLVLAGLGTWWKLSQRDGSAPLAATSGTMAPTPESGPAMPAPTQTLVTPTGAVASDLATDSPAPGDATHISEAERLRLSLERLEREDRERTAALAQQRAAMAAEQERRAELARRRAEATAAATAASPAPTPASSPQSPATAPAVAKTEATAPPAASAATVELACAGSSNFFTRDLCRVRECRKPAFARDPICVKFREMEESNRRSLAQ